MAYSKSTPSAQDYERTLRYEHPAGVTNYNYSYKDTWNNTRSGEKMPDYKEKIRLGLQASTPFTCDYARLVSAYPGYLHHEIRQSLPPHNVYTQKATGFQYYSYTRPAHLSVDKAKADSIALSKVYKKIDSELSHMNSPAVLAEFVDVIRQFGNPMRSIIDLTNRRFNRLELERRSLKGSTSFKRIRWSEIVASTYLEYAFGLAPLIGDTQKVAETLARFNTEEELHKFRKRVVSRVTAQRVTNSTDAPVAGSGLWAKYQLSTRTSTEYRVQYTVGLDSPPIAAYGSNDRLLQLLGFRPEKWVPALWEAVPWSWLIDYFTNVGAILEAGASSTAAVKWLCKTESYRTTVHYTTRWMPDHSTDGGGQRVKFHGTHAGLSKVERTTVNRTIPLSLGIPPLYVEHPFDNLKKVANMAAVLLARKPGQSALWIF